MSLSTCIWTDCDQVSITEYGLCTHHHWAFRASVEDGLHHLRLYLAAWAAFSEWLEAHEVAA